MANRIYAPRKGDAEYERELEANLFAMNLTMPEAMMHREVQMLAPDGFDIVEEPAFAKLAKRFRTSEQLIILRLVQLGYFDEILRR